MRHAYRNQPRSYPKQQRQPISSNSPQYHQNQHQYGTGIRAAVQTRHSIEFRDVPAQQTIHEIPIIMVGARSVPLNILFQSRSSQLHIQNEHEPAQGSVQETSSEDQPHHLIHRVSKPIIQEVFEIIRPYRKITQEVVPVQEEIQTVVARAVDNKYVPAYNQFNEKNIENPTSNAYPSSGVNQLQEPFSPVSLQSYGLIPQQLEQQPLKSIPKESDYSFLPVNSESIQSYMSPKDSDFIWKLLEPKIFSSTIENKDYGTQPSSLSKSMGTESYLFAPLSLETIFDKSNNPIVSQSPRTILIETIERPQPINLIFRSLSSQLNLIQDHQESNDEESNEREHYELIKNERPIRMILNITKPIIQEVNEMIVPIRNIRQQIQPIQEFIETKVMREQFGFEANHFAVRNPNEHHHRQQQQQQHGDVNEDDGSEELNSNDESNSTSNNNNIDGSHHNESGDVNPNNQNATIVQGLVHLNKRNDI
ncbi:DFP2-like protein 11 [Sarcoptes scabiei]|uniref:DFP2-like protein 11 n=1 Tax=Sarcoptes scabiei TaxID=52283 RepID=A0A131ZZ01_SARSC|nr:DFP2-like protein 11 [Sarcoptes scabiei]